LYVGLLKSRTIADKLVAAHGLEKVYDAETREDARKGLAGATDIDSGKDGLITIAVLDKDSKRAALLANAYVDELKKLTTVLAVTEAGQRRMFFERQLESTKDKLAKAEIALKGALDTHGVISVDSESRAVLVTMGRMRAQISAKEIELQSMGQFVTPNNQQYRQVQAEISSLRAELAKFENGRPADSEGSAADKQSGLENVKVLREVKYYQMLYELLAKQYEVARLDEAKDSYAVQLLDPAVEPERKFKPARAMIVILSGALAFFAAVVIAFMREANAKSLQRPGGMARWNELKSHLRFRKQD
jgi:tyrosine-protein kinase Etk/Wzc